MKYRSRTSRHIWPGHDFSSKPMRTESRRRPTWRAFYFFPFRPVFQGRTNGLSNRVRTGDDSYGWQTDTEVSGPWQAFIYDPPPPLRTDQPANRIYRWKWRSIGRPCLESAIGSGEIIAPISRPLFSSLSFSLYYPYISPLSLSDPFVHSTFHLPFHLPSIILPISLCVAAGPIDGCVTHEFRAF